MKTLRLIILSALAIIFAGCSSKPSESQARDTLNSMIESQSNGLITLDSFTKTDGIILRDGDGAYEMDYAAVIAFQEDCSYGDPPSGQRPFLASKALPQTLSQKFMSFGKQIGRKGKKLSVSGIMGFKKTEKGWRLTNFTAIPNQPEAAQAAAADIATVGAIKMQWMAKGGISFVGDEHSETSIINLTITESALETKAPRVNGAYSFADIISVQPNQQHRMDISVPGYPSFWFKTAEERDRIVVDLDKAIRTWIANNPEAQKSPYRGISK